MNTPSPPLLEVTDLSVSLLTRGGWVRVVADLSYTVRSGESLAIVGESGSGKTMAALALINVFPPAVQAIVAGSARLKGRELIGMDFNDLRAVRGGEIGFAFQNPGNALNPLRSIGAQIADSARLHLGLKRRAAWERAIELLNQVGIPAPHRRVHDLPGAFSGGMRQRAMIAVALAGEPSLVVIDEPTTALDVTIQAQIIEMLHGLRDQAGTAFVLISHDMGVVAALADRVFVMYASRFVEAGAVESVLIAPRHPYTAALLSSVPRLDADPDVPLDPIPGLPPPPEAMPGGCSFHPRCGFRTPRCMLERPPLQPTLEEEAHSLACWHPLALVDRVER